MAAQEQWATVRARANQQGDIYLLLLCAYTVIKLLLPSRRCMQARTGRLTGAFPEVVPVIHQVAHVDWWVATS